ncbi:uncharacterized protein [Euwallacea fornicatus]|uniref:uncharacterized protein n=1 Tax=Euwallacea fornicatus TaxID=995702 RepID=UPI00338EEB7E
MERPSNSCLKNVATVDNLLTLVKDIARGQANEISDEDTKKTCELRFKDATSVATSSHFFDSLDKEVVKREVESLLAALEGIAADGFLVKNHGIKKTYVPSSYEVLGLIFAQTNEKFRQAHLHKLLDLFYNELQINLELNGSKLQLNRSRFDFEVKTLLPLVKLEILHDLIESTTDNDRISELVSNITNFFNNPRINQEDIYVVARNKLGSNSFDLNSYELIQMDQRNGHLGDYFRLHMEINRGGDDEKLTFFAKFLTPKSEFMKNFLKYGPSMKEDFFYMILLPKLEEAGLGQLIDFAPNCYFSRVDDVLVLDDMSQDGFVGLTPNIKLEFDALKLAVQGLAKFHSCSIILEEILTQKRGSDVRLNEIYEPYLKEVAFTEDLDHIPLMQTVFESCILHCLSKFTDIRGQYSDEELARKVTKGFALLLEKVKPSQKFRNVICHGDVYVANMLFKFNGQGNCLDFKLIDFQILRYCPPTQDLLFFLYQNSLKSVLDVHFEELICEYYNALSSHLAKYNVDINNIYPRETFDQCLNYMKPEGVCHALCYSPMQTLDPEMREKMIQSDAEIEKMMVEPVSLIDWGLKDEYYEKVLRGLCEHFIGLCDKGLL